MRSLKTLAEAKLVKLSLTLTLIFVILYLLPVPTTGEPVEDLAQEWSRFVIVNGVKIHYVEEFGEGDYTFILLHGFGASVFSWREVFKELSKYGRVVGFDRPGFGLTERVNPAEVHFNPYSTEGQVELTYELLGKLNVSKVVLVGHSVGGGLALLLVLRHPDLVRALVLIAPAWEPSQNSLFETLLYSFPLSDKYGPLVVRGLVGQLEQVLYRAWYNKSRLTNEVVEGYKYPLRARDWDKGLYWLMKYRGFPDIKEELKLINVPTLVIHGVNDEIVPLNSSLELVNQLNPVALHGLITVERCGHLPHEEIPEEFMRVMKEFLEGLST